MPPFTSTGQPPYADAASISIEIESPLGLRALWPYATLDSVARGEGFSLSAGSVTVQSIGSTHRLNMDLDLLCLFRLHVQVCIVHSCTHWLRPRKPSPTPTFGFIYWGVNGQPR